MYLYILWDDFLDKYENHYGDDGYYPDKPSFPRQHHFYGWKNKPSQIIGGLASGNLLHNQTWQWKMDHLTCKRCSS